MAVKEGPVPTPARRAKRDTLRALRKATTLHAGRGNLRGAEASKEVERAVDNQ